MISKVLLHVSVSQPRSRSKSLVPPSTPVARSASVGASGGSEGEAGARGLRRHLMAAERLELLGARKSCGAASPCHPNPPARSRSGAEAGGEGKGGVRWNLRIGGGGGGGR